MISKQEFGIIDNEIKNSIESTLSNIRASRPGDYILFLADGEYKEEYDKPTIKFNPYVIDSREDRYKDQDRLVFLSELLSLYYSFPTNQTVVDDNIQRMHIELMVYTHIWESKSFLRRLYRLAHLDNGEQYDWNVVVDDMSKHKFIRKRVRDVFETNGNPMWEVIKHGFHTSLRNAFAHSEYSFDRMNNNKCIVLHNFKGDTSWELDSITFDEWSRRFVYSALLSYHLLSLSSKHRKSLIESFGTDQLQIKHPTKNGSSRMVWITYRPQHDAFNFT